MKINIKYLDKISVLERLYNATDLGLLNPVTYSTVYHYCSLYDFYAISFGASMGIRTNGDILDATHYDQLFGAGAAERALGIVNDHCSNIKNLEDLEICLISARSDEKKKILYSHGFY